MFSLPNVDNTALFVVAGDAVTVVTFMPVTTRSVCPVIEGEEAEVESDPTPTVVANVMGLVATVSFGSEDTPSLPSVC